MRTRIAALLVFLGLALVITLTVSAQELPPPASARPISEGTGAQQAQSVELVGQLSGTAHAVAVAGNYAYLAAGGAGLRIIDITNPAAPTEVGHWDTPEYAVGVAVAGNYTYIADGYGGLRIINIANPAAPTEVGSYYMPVELALWSANDVAVAGNYAYILFGSSRGWSGLCIVNVANAVTPTKVGVLTTWPGSDVAVAGNYAYIAEGYDGLHIVNVANPAEPREVGFYDTPGWAVGVAVAGNYAYIANSGMSLGKEGRGLSIVNIITPTAPSEVAHYDAISDARAVAVAGNYTYVAAGEGLYIVNVANPAAPIEVGSYDRPGNSLDVAVAGNYVFVADGGGLLILRFTGFVPKPTAILVHGWQGFGLPGSGHSCGEGIVQFVSGVPTDFERLPDWLVQDGWDVWIAHLRTGPLYTPPIEQNARCLADQIGRVKTDARVSEVTLIAHSMGGIVSRAYMESDEYRNRRDVNRLFTLGSPHQGLPIEVVMSSMPLLALTCLNQPGMCELSILGMRDFNRDHPGRAGGVPYYLVSGDLSFFDSRGFGRILQPLIAVIAGRNDAVVPTSSGRTLAGSRQALETSEAHSPGLGRYSYFIPPPGDTYTRSLAYAQCISPVLVGGNADGCRSLQPAVAQAGPSFTAYTPPVTGTLRSGQAATHTVSLDGGGAALFALHNTTGTVGFTLTSPVGQAIDPAYAQAHPNEADYLASVPGEPAGASYYLTTTLPGTWLLHVRAITVPAEGTGYAILVAMETPITLTVGTDRTWYSAGQRAAITVTLGGSPASASVQGEIRRPDGLTETLTFTSQGGGVYRAQYVITGTPGYAVIRATATGTDSGGRPFARQAVGSFQIASNAAVLSGTYADRPVPAAGGYYQALEVEVGLTTVVSGAFSLSADLTSPSGDFVAHALTYTLLVTGPQTVTLRFDGNSIFASQRDGPYTLTNLWLVDNRAAAVPAQTAEAVYTTTNIYRYRDFAPGQLYLPFVSRNS